MRDNSSNEMSVRTIISYFLIIFEHMIKRIFDLFFSLSALILLSPILVVSWLLAGIDTHTNGLFLQERIGQFGKAFTIFKLRTMHPSTKKVSNIGAFLRKYKLDELPQLLNVLQGTMSIVGPRPDVSGYYDKLEGEQRKILELKPGLTSLAAIKYTNEEVVLNQQQNPLQYNDTILFPDKVKLNLAYYYHHSLWVDIKIIVQTLIFLTKN